MGGLARIGIQAIETRKQVDKVVIPLRGLINEAEEGLIDLVNSKIQCETDLSICRENLR